MSYCVFTDIQEDFKTIAFDSSSLIKDTQVTKFITEASALIDSYVGTRWVVPITADASSLALMSLFCRTLVADRIRGILANKQQTNTDANQQVKSDGYSVKDVMKALTDIKNGDTQLSGAALLLAGSAFYSQNYATNQTPRFNKNRRQW